MLIGLNQQLDKLVFERMRFRFPVIANQRARWCGNPPVRGKMYRYLPTRVGSAAFLVGNRYLVPFNRGIATEAVALARNDSISLQTPIYLSEMG